MITFIKLSSIFGLYSFPNSLSFSYGLINDTMHILPDKLNSLDTSQTLRMFSALSSALNPKSLFRSSLTTIVYLNFYNMINLLII